MKFRTCAYRHYQKIKSKQRYFRWVSKFCHCSTKSSTKYENNKNLWNICVIWLLIYFHSPVKVFDKLVCNIEQFSFEILVYVVFSHVQHSENCFSIVHIKRVCQINVELKMIQNKIWRCERILEFLLKSPTWSESVFRNNLDSFSSSSIKYHQQSIATNFIYLLNFNLPLFNQKSTSSWSNLNTNNKVKCLRTHLAEIVEPMKK